MTVVPGRSACYRCLFPEPPDPAVAPPARTEGCGARSRVSSGR
jgi:molybdopterin/thiamine biosynthesis adenylyltransferase